MPTKPKRAPAEVDLKKENATLRLELAEALERQTAASEVLQVISSTPDDLEPVFQSLLENATRVCGAKFGTMLMLEGDVVRQASLYNVPPAYAVAFGTRTFRPHPKGGAGQVIRTKQAAHIADLRTNPAYLEGDPNIVALSDLAEQYVLFCSSTRSVQFMLGRLVDRACPRPGATATCGRKA